jgi:hypothetical protein
MRTFVHHENPSGKNSFRFSTDAYSLDESLQIFAVADPPFRMLTRLHKDYPQEDFSKLASQIFCTVFVDSARERIEKDESFNEQSFIACMSNANKAIFDLNMELGREFNIPTQYDVAETVGMAAVVFDGILYDGGLEDCYVNLLRGDNFVDIHKFDYQIMKSSKYMDNVSKTGGLSKHIDPEVLKLIPDEYHWEAFWCTYLRNNTDIMDKEGRRIGWGCFTGEDSAMSFVQTHKAKIKKDDHLLLFSDGMIPATENRDLMQWFTKNVNTSFRFHEEFSAKLEDLNKDLPTEFSEKLILYTKL